MKLFIVRHAIAEERGKKFYPKDDRLLTKTGIKKMKANAEGLTVLLPSSCIIITSPLKRSFYTAKIISARSSEPAVITLDDALLPNASAAAVISMLKKFEKHPTVLLVGHQPSLGKFLAFVLQQKNGSADLKKGSVCCLKYNPAEPTRATLQFSIPPKVLRMIGSKKK